MLNLAIVLEPILNLCLDKEIKERPVYPLQAECFYIQNIDQFYCFSIPKRATKF